MARVRAEFELDSELLRLAEARAAATGTRRDAVIEEALRRVLEPGALAGLVARVRGRSDLTAEQAFDVAYAELDAARAQRSRHAAS